MRWAIMVVGALSVVLLAGCRPAPETHAKSEHLVELDSAEQFREIVVNSDGVCLVDFYADWCGPCQRLAPTMHQLADELVGKVTVVKVNVDNFRALTEEYKVSSIPDVRIFVNGEQVDRVVGQEVADEYRKRLTRHAGL